MIWWLINMQQLVECELVGETEILKQNTSHFVHHISYMTSSGIELTPLRWETRD
jgi:hypothetical protein